MTPPRTVPSGDRTVAILASPGTPASEIDRVGAAGRQEGADIVLVVPPDVTGIAADIETRLVPFALPAGLNPMTTGNAAGRLAGLFRDIRPDGLVCLGLSASLIGGAACLLSGIDARLFRLDAPAGALRGRAAGILLRGPLSGRRTRFLLGWPEDAAALGFAAGDPAVTTLARAGPEIWRTAIRTLLAGGDP